MAWMMRGHCWQNPLSLTHTQKTSWAVDCDKAGWLCMTVDGGLGVNHTLNLDWWLIFSASGRDIFLGEIKDKITDPHPFLISFIYSLKHTSSMSSSRLFPTNLRNNRASSFFSVVQGVFQPLFSFETFWKCICEFFYAFIYLNMN